MKNTLIRSKQDEHGTWWFIQASGTRQRAKVKLCPTCSEQFLDYPTSGSSYCSSECYRKNCIRCGCEFHPSTVRQVYCSDVCKRGTASCQCCGKDFVPTKKSAGLFCSKSCFNDFSCPMFSVRDAGNGYKIIKVPPETPGNKISYGPNKKGWMLEHRYAMQQKLGRALEGHENVHHINGDRGDNRPENLELWRRPQPSGVRAHDYHCAGCSCFKLAR